MLTDADDEQEGCCWMRGLQIVRRATDTAGRNGENVGNVDVARQPIIPHLFRIVATKSPTALTEPDRGERPFRFRRDQPLPGQGPCFTPPGGPGGQTRRAVDRGSLDALEASSGMKRATRVRLARWTVLGESANWSTTAVAGGLVLASWSHEL